MADGEIASRKLKLVTSSPGIIFLLAGLVIIALTITEKSDFKQVDNVNSGQKISETKIQKADAESVSDLTARLTSYRLASESSELKLAEQYFNLARNSANEDQAHAIDYLAMAITINPDLLKKAQEVNVFKDILNNSDFKEFARLRLKMAISKTDESPLKPQMKLVLNVLNIHALSVPKVENTQEIEKLIQEIPLAQSTEPAEKTIEKINLLLQKDPRSLHKLLKNPKYQWISGDDIIFSWLKKGSDEFFIPK